MAYRFAVLCDDAVKINRVRRFLERRFVPAVYSLKKGYVLFSGDDVCSEIIGQYPDLKVYKLEVIAADDEAATKRT